MKPVCIPLYRLTPAEKKLTGEMVTSLLGFFVIVMAKTEVATKMTIRGCRPAPVVDEPTNHLYSGSKFAIQQLKHYTAPDSFSRSL